MRLLGVEVEYTPYGLRRAWLRQFWEACDELREARHLENRLRAAREQIEAAGALLDLGVVTPGHPMPTIKEWERQNRRART